MSLLIIGDTHGNYSNYLDILKKYKYKYDESVQIGDHGILSGQLPPQVSKKDFFFCGNHDDYKKVENHPNYLGRFGDRPNYFFISGGFSPDFARRTPTIDWVEYEELSIEEMEQCCDLYLESDSKIMLTHEPPDFLVDDLIAKNPRPVNFPRKASRTGLFLNLLWNLHQPTHWFFGHWHYSYSIRKEGTLFSCIPNDKALLFEGV